MRERERESKQRDAFVNLEEVWSIGVWIAVLRLLDLFVLILLASLFRGRYFPIASVHRFPFSMCVRVTTATAVFRQIHWSDRFGNE